MSLSFPLPFAEFGQRLPIQSAPWKLRRFEEMSWSAGAVPDVAELADPRWSCRVTLDIMTLDEAAEIEALIEAHGSAKPFLLHDPRRAGPQFDREGLLIGSAAVTVAAVSPGAVSLTGLPAGYTLTRGDRLALLHGAGRRGLHTVSATVVADLAGTTPAIPLTPAPRSVVAVGQSVELVVPKALMLIVPDSYEPGTMSGGVVRGMTFDAVEAW